MRDGMDQNASLHACLELIHPSPSHSLLLALFHVHKKRMGDGMEGGGKKKPRGGGSGFGDVQMELGMSELLAERCGRRGLEGLARGGPKALDLAE